MMPDGSVNPEEMTSFNHYCFGSVASFLHERVAGLRQVEAGWKKCRIAPLPGGTVRHASSRQLTPYGWLGCSWELTGENISIEVTVPAQTTAELIIPGSGEHVELQNGHWSFVRVYQQRGEWPVAPVPSLPI